MVGRAQPRSDLPATLQSRAPRTDGQIGDLAGGHPYRFAVGMYDPAVQALQFASAPPAIVLLSEPDVDADLIIDSSRIGSNCAQTTR